MGIYTYAERMKAGSACYEAFTQIETAFDLLREVWERNFGTASSPIFRGMKRR